MKKLLLIFLFIPIVSFGQKNTESELIMKINAVQHQLMVQGNITEEQLKAAISEIEHLNPKPGGSYAGNNRIAERHRLNNGYSKGGH